MSPFADDPPPVLARSAGLERVACYLVTTNHSRYAVPGFFPRGSVVVDPWGYIPEQDSVTLIRVGRK